MFPICSRASAPLCRPQPTQGRPDDSPRPCGVKALRTDEARLTRLAVSYPRMSPRRDPFRKTSGFRVSGKSRNKLDRRMAHGPGIPSSNSRLGAGDAVEQCAKRSSNPPARPGQVTPLLSDTRGQPVGNRSPRGPRTLQDHPKGVHKNCRAWSMTDGGRALRSVSDRNRQSVAKGLEDIEAPLLRGLNHGPYSGTHLPFIRHLSHRFCLSGQEKPSLPDLACHGGATWCKR